MLTNGPGLTVLPWPESAQFLQQTRSTDRTQSNIVVSVTTPLTTIRHIARERIRSALREALGILLDLPAQSVPLISAPGQACRIALPNQQSGLSISHQPGLSVAAINLRGAIGIDLMQPDAVPDWQQVAHDYLGPQVCKRILEHPENRQAHAFAQAWTRYEASLKCLGLGINEWHTALHNNLRRCSVTELALPNGSVGAVATLL